MITKGELVERLKDYPDDYPVYLRWIDGRRAVPLVDTNVQRGERPMVLLQPRTGVFDAELYEFDSCDSDDEDDCIVGSGYLSYMSGLINGALHVDLGNIVKRDEVYFVPVNNRLSNGDRMAPFTFASLEDLENAMSFVQCLILIGREGVTQSIRDASCIHS